MKLTNLLYLGLVGVVFVAGFFVGKLSKSCPVCDVCDECPSFNCNECPLKEKECPTEFTEKECQIQECEEKECPVCQVCFACPDCVCNCPTETTTTLQGTKFLSGQQTPEQQELINSGKCTLVKEWFGARQTWYWVC